MRILEPPFFVIIFILSSVVSVAQQTDCLHPKEIIITNQENTTISEEIYYQEDDAYTFWYKISSNELIDVKYELKSIAPDDDYELFVYTYDGTNFCNDLVNQTTKPTQLASKGSLRLKKNHIFYISVLHLNGKGCGHELFLLNARLNYVFKAIQNTCVEEIAAAIIEKEAIKDSIKPMVETQITQQPNVEEMVQTPVLKNLFKGITINKETNQLIEAEITLITIENNTKQQFVSTKEEGFMFVLNNNKPLFVTIEKLGYKPYKDTIYDFDTVVKIALNPLSVGEKIVMHKIYFYPNTAVLKATSKKELEKLLNFIQENESYTLEIQGHTNGNRKIKKDKKNAHLGEEWNFSGSAKELSQLRAEKIKTFLQEKGVKDKNLIAKGYGGDKMIVEYPKNMQEAMKNIRVEIVVVE
jgi:outer membrane protein OmpA-like peptidoglycan-associated protein